MTMDDKKNAKNATKFICEICDFKCYKLSNYNVHVLTRKHKILQNPTEENAKNAEYICDCNKVYKHHSSLWNHKKKCNFIKIEETKVIPLSLTLNRSKGPSTIVSSSDQSILISLKITVSR